MSNRKYSSLFFVMLLIHPVFSFASGMVPETSLLLINEQQNGGSMNVKNTDAHPSLLYTNIIDLPDDKDIHVIVTQPVTRVDSGEVQRLRFILQSNSPLKVEHLKRVTFEGIPPRTKDGHQVAISIRQNLPVLIHPADLPVVSDVWKKLKWSVSGNTVTVKNDSPYVVRLNQNFNMKPSQITLKLKQTYILPGESFCIQSSHLLDNEKQVQIFPVSRYGVETPDFTADIVDGK